MYERNPESCYFNREIVCEKTEKDVCSLCGWNPKVADIRLRRIKAKLGIKDKEERDD